jgi:sugar/nucleoside kinase (ribokinase family)
VFEARVGDDPFGEILRFLESRGVDVERELEYVRSAQQRRAAADRSAAEDVMSLARAHAKARRKALDEQRWWMHTRKKADLDIATSAMAYADQLEAELRAACVNDAELLADVKARAARQVSTSTA